MCVLGWAWANTVVKILHEIYLYQCSCFFMRKGSNSEMSNNQESIAYYMYIFHLQTQATM